MIGEIVLIGLSICGTSFVTARITRKPKKEYGECINGDPHVWDMWSENNNGSQTRKCFACNLIETKNIVSACDSGDHNFTQWSDPDKFGIQTRSCKDCNEKDSQYVDDEESCERYCHRWSQWHSDFSGSRMQNRYCTVCSIKEDRIIDDYL